MSTTPTAEKPLAGLKVVEMSTMITCALAAMNVPDGLAMFAFFGLTVFGSALWFLQRLTLGRRLAAEGL